MAFEGRRCPKAQPQDCTNPTINRFPKREYHVYEAQHYSQQDAKIDGKNRDFQKARHQSRLASDSVTGRYIYKDIFIKNTT